MCLKSRSLLQSKRSLLSLNLSHFSGPFGPRVGDSSNTVGPCFLYILCGSLTPIHTFVIGDFVNEHFSNYSAFKMSCFILDP